MMISCQEVVTELWDYLDGELPVERAALIADHLVECARCYPQYRFEYAFLAAVSRQRSLGPGPSPALVEKVAGAVLASAVGVPAASGRRPTAGGAPRSAPRAAEPLPARVPLMAPRARAERWALAILRLSLGALVLLCGVRLGVPAVTGAASPGLLGGVAALELSFSAIILLGVWRRWSYGAALLVHGASLFLLWQLLRDPWGIILAGLPACGALIALYLLRDRDTWTLDAWLAWRRPWRVVR